MNAALIVVGLILVLTGLIRFANNYQQETDMIRHLAGKYKAGEMGYVRGGIEWLEEQCR